MRLSECFLRYVQLHEPECGARRRGMGGTSPINKAIECVYEMGDASPLVQEFHDRHDTPSLLILTIFDKREAVKVCKRVFYEILGKTVVEIGAGVGYFALEMAKHAKRVYAIESDPAWSWAFTQHLYKTKPPHLTWIFGRAEMVAEWLRADVAVILTRSGQTRMREIGRRMAPKVIDVYGLERGKER